MSMNELYPFSQEDLPEPRQTTDNCGQTGSVVGDDEGQIINFESIGQYPNPLPVLVLMSDHYYLNRFGCFE